jgi:succinylglutamate desuccinylase
MIQNMNRMFEQRRQIQAQQNHSAQDQQPNAN